MKTINSLRSKLLALTLALVASVSSFAKDGYPDFQVDGLYYNFLEGDSVQVTFLMPPTIPTEVAADASNKKNVSGAGYSHLTEIVIPSTVIYEDKTYHVTRIGHGAFMYCPNLMHIDLPTSIKSIGIAAFRNCRTLASITLNEGLESIEHHAFYDCVRLKEVTLPSTLKTMGQSIFYFSADLEKVTCKAIVPPTVEKDVLTDTDNYNAAIIANATLYVPAQSLTTYQNTYPWNTFGQILPIEDSFKDLFPTLWGLERTDVEGTTMGYDDPYHMSFSKYTPTLVDGIWYLFDGRNYFREANNQILWYAPYLNTVDAVLYDWTLQVGDTLPIYSNPFHKDNNRGSLFRVTDVSTITLLDGKEYKKWTFSGGFEVVEGIGAINKGFGHYYCLLHTTHPAVYTGWKPICISKNGQLLYQMDDAEMERLGAECLCEVEKKWSDTWCNQWNILSHGYQGQQDPLAAAHTSIFWLSNNTVNRDGHEYFPLMCSSSMPEVESTTLIGELRFTEDKQVYFNYDNTEYLLYDFDVQVGDTLDIFGGIELYSYSFVEQKTYPHVITKIDTLDDGRLQITSDAIVIFEDSYGAFEEKMPQTWIEGLGSTNGIVYTSINPGIAGDAAIVMLCAYRDDECVYKTDSNDPYWIDYTQLGCVYNEGDFIEGAFPILSGLQRTVYDEFCGEAEIGAVYTGKQTFDKIFFENDKPYILCNDYLLREEDNKILIYSQLLNKDLVLYDFTLEVGDSLPALYIDYQQHNAMDWMPYNIGVVDYNKDFDGTIYPADTFVVTDVSNVTLLDGKEYKKWTFNNGMEYVEGIGMYGGHRNGNFVGLIQDVVVPCHIGTHLVCVSKNGKLLYYMDDTEMERLGAECLCEAETPEDLFPTLWGLQRTTFYHYTECSDSYSSLTASNEIVTINDKPYLRFGKMFLREENNQVLIYSAAYDKDLVLYDWNLEVGDSISLLAMDYGVYPEYAVSVVDYRVIVDIDENGDLITDTIPTDKVVVDKISTITLLDGKEYKTWHLATGWAGGITYVEGIGILSEGYGGGDYLGLIRPEELPTCYYGDLLVCVSKNNKLLYQMDDAEMERLGAECLCDYDRGPRKDNAKDGQIGGRPTPTQWNMLEMELRKMENGISILQAETFSYTLEDISQQVNSRTYFQLARQSTKDTATTKSVVGALHFGKEEDNRVYFLRDGVEYVLYDFTADPGDTVEIFAGINNYPQETTYTHVVTSKDTLENGACRMMLEVVFPEETSTAENVEKVWLAGLGSVDGIVHNAAKRTSDVHAAPARSASSETQTSVMLCAWREDSCLYTTDHPDYDTFGCVYNQDPTSVENPTSPSSYQKLLRDGQLLIIHNDKIYNVLGLDIGKSSIKIVESLTNN